MDRAADDILIVTRHYAPEPTGSAPVMQEIAEWLARNGDAVRVLTVRPNYPGAQIFDGYRQGEHDQATENGVSVTRRPTRPVKGAGMLARLGPELGFMLDAAFAGLFGRMAKAQSVISLCPSTLTPIGARFLVKRGGRHVVIVHDIQSGLGAALGSGGVRLLMPILRWLEALALNSVDHVVVLSRAMKDALIALGVRRPITILPPSIDTTKITPQLRPDGAPPTLLYSGNLGRKQGLEQLIELAAVLAVRAPEVRIIIRGDGAMRQQLEKDAADRALPNIRFAPLAPKSELSAGLAEGDVHLVPQIATGGDFAVPSKAFAIMAAGRPFVATAEPGSPLDQLARESGAFVCTPPMDAEAFAEAVTKLLGDAPERQVMGDRGRAYVLGEVDTEVVMRKLNAALSVHAPGPIQ